MDYSDIRPNVQIIDLGYKVDEIVVLNEDDTYTIFINARASHEAQLEAYAHALKHISNNDFNKLNVQDIEAEAHKL